MGVTESVVQILSDADRLHRFVHGDAGEIIQTEAGNIVSLNHAQAQITEKLYDLATFNPRGTWAPLTSYNQKDLLINETVVYVVVSSHTSSVSIQTDLSAGLLAIWQGSDALLSEMYSTIKGLRYISSSSAITNHSDDNVLGSLANIIDICGLNTVSIFLPSKQSPYDLGGQTLTIPESVHFDFDLGATITNGSIIVNGPSKTLSFPKYSNAMAYKALFAGQEIQIRGRSAAGDGAGGKFLGTLSDISEYVAIDTQHGVYLPFAFDMTGASGGWVRDVSDGDPVRAKWFGSYVGSGLNCNDAVMAADAFAKEYGGGVLFTKGHYITTQTATMYDGMTWISSYKERGWAERVQIQNVTTDMFALSADTRDVTLQGIFFSGHKDNTNFLTPVNLTSGYILKYSSIENCGIYEFNYLFSGRFLYLDFRGNYTNNHSKTITMAGSDSDISRNNFGSPYLASGVWLIDDRMGLTTWNKNFYTFTPSNGIKISASSKHLSEMVDGYTTKSDGPAFLIQSCIGASIIGCTIKDNLKTPSGYYTAPVVIADSSGVAVIGNVFENQTAAYFCSIYQSAGTVDNVTVTGNLFKNCTSKKLYRSGTITNLIFDGGANKISGDSVSAFSNGDTSPDVSDNLGIYKTANTSATLINAFDGHALKQRITVLVEDNYTTFVFTSGSLLKGNGGANFVASSGDWIEAVYDGSYWRCSCHDCTT